MTRINHLFEQIAEYSNIRAAFLKAIRGKRSSPEVVFFCRNVDRNLQTIRERLLSENPRWGAYRTFAVTDPKPRIISAVPFEDRVLHHAIMNILEPLFEKHFVCHTYACRKGKGTHAAVRYAFSRCKANTWFCKLDVRKYFDSIDHGVLKNQLRRMIKDGRLLLLLDSIIDSYRTLPGKGVPIGNLTSQFFANLYLSALDHYILEHLRPKAYVRYMDDFVFWGDDEAEMQNMLTAVEAYCAEELRLTLKPVGGKPAILGKTDQGIPFLGFLVKSGGIFLLPKSKARIRSRMAEINTAYEAGLISDTKAAERLQSVRAAVLLARSRAFVLKITGAASGSNRVNRGGSWNNNAANLRSANRNNNTPSNRNNNLGFRVVRP